MNQEAKTSSKNRAKENSQKRAKENSQRRAKEASQVSQPKATKDAPKVVAPKLSKHQSAETRFYLIASLNQEG